MAMITPALLSALFTGYKQNFEAGKSEAELQYTKIATVVPSTSSSNTYGWLGKFPTLKKWVGDRVLESMQAHKYQIENEDFESTVAVDRNDIEDDNLGIYAPLFKEMGSAAAIHPELQVMQLLENGFTNPCYDGQNFFDTDHPVAPNADGTGVAVSVSNMQAGADTPWFVLDCSKALKPLIFQERKKPQLIAMTKVDDEAVFMSKQFRYGVDCRDAAGYGFWQMAFASQATLNADNLWAAIKSMRGFTADGGRKLGIKATHLVVPSSLEDVATKLLMRELDGGGNTNELKGRLQLIVADHL